MWDYNPIHGSESWDAPMSQSSYAPRVSPNQAQLAPLIPPTPSAAQQHPLRTLFDMFQRSAPFNPSQVSPMAAPAFVPQPQQVPVAGMSDEDYADMMNEYTTGAHALPVNSLPSLSNFAPVSIPAPAPSPAPAAAPAKKPAQKTKGATGQPQIQMVKIKPAPRSTAPPAPPLPPPVLPAPIVPSHPSRRIDSKSYPGFVAAQTDNGLSYYPFA